MSKTSEIKVFKPRVARVCVHWTTTNCSNKNVMAVEFLDPPRRIDFFCDKCIKPIKKVYKEIRHGQES